MADLPNSHGIPRINNKYNQESFFKKEREREKDMIINFNCISLLPTHVFGRSAFDFLDQSACLGSFPTPCQA